MPEYPTDRHLYPAGDVPDIAWAYHSLIDMMGEIPGAYQLDEKRTEYHQELCRVYGLSKEQTKTVTDHLDQYETAVKMDIALRKLEGDS